ncbi:MAG TPA: NifU family protein [Polyangiaceae bacterium]|nr:NifU family protein [Polyangiaceae bacterium]
MDEPNPSARAHIERVCREVLAPLVRADGGEMHIVRFEGDDIYIHLSGACAGCPGAALTEDKVILPALRAAAPKVRVILTTGVRAPAGAQKVR